MLNYNPLNQKELDQTVDAIFKECEELEEQKEQKKKDKIRKKAIRKTEPNRMPDPFTCFIHGCFILIGVIGFIFGIIEGDILLGSFCLVSNWGISWGIYSCEKDQNRRWE